MTVGRVLRIVLAVVCFNCVWARGEDWPMFGRDSTRNAVSPEKNPPTDWRIETRTEAGLVTTRARNIKWKASLGSHTYGEPIISQGLVWICTNNEGHRDPAITKDAGCLMCFNESNGKFRWQYLTPKIGNQFQDWPGNGGGSPPLVEGDRLWFLDNRWEVVCFDIAPLLNGTGSPRELWKLDLQRDLGVFGTDYIMGANIRCTISASYKGMIYVLTGNGTEQTHSYAPAPEAPALICIAKDTGKVIWKDASPGREIYNTQCASPLVAEIDGKAQVIAPEGDGWIRSFEPLTGKLIWKFDTNPKSGSYPMTRGELVAPPVPYEHRLYVTVGQAAYTNGLAPVWCIDPTREGDISAELDDGPLEVPPPSTRPGRARRGKPNPNSGVIWKFDGIRVPDDIKPVHADRMHRVLGSVAVADGLVIAADYEGFVHCLDATTGRQYWVHGTSGEIYGSPLICDRKVYIGDEEDLTILALSKKLEVVAVREFNQAIHSSPVLANGVLYVVTRDTMYAIGSTDTTTDAYNDWPQYRGPDRTNISRDRGLARTWTVKGPPLLWKASGLGEGVPSVAVAQGHIYTLGYREDGEFLSSFDTGGHRVWARRIGPVVPEQPAMRWLSQRTPTVDDELVFAVTARGVLLCLSTSEGTIRWQKDCVADLGGVAGMWGYCDFPLVDANQLICSPGGKEGAVVALEKSTGKVIWKCAVPGVARATYCAAVAAEIAGVPQYVQQFDTCTVGAGTDGKLLWQYDGVTAGFRGNVHTAVVQGDKLFCSVGWGAGYALVDLKREGERFAVSERYRFPDPRVVAFDNWFGNSSLLGERVFTNSAACVDLETGKIVWRTRLSRPITMVVADGRLFMRLGDGTMVMAEANPEKYVETGRFLPPRTTQETAWTTPVIAGGRLYLRDQDELLCYDLREDRSRAFDPPATRPAAALAPAPDALAPLEGPVGRRASDAVFVPTPHDVVDQMLKLAAVTKKDLVVDLGCGDGRIVVAAAKQYGCRATGYDTDPECVRLSKENVLKDKVEGLVRIVQKDIFTVDVSEATVIALYMGREVNARLVPQLQKLKPGSRIVSHNFDIEGFVPDKVVDYVSGEDDTKHTLYLWTIPLKTKG